jgi:uncharacterized protein YfaS (alpha-2-macroglobulin family)
VAYFAGPVEVGADGYARTDIHPAVVQRHGETDGRCLVEIILWAGQQDVLVRDPVVVTASVPRFLAPGDDFDRSGLRSSTPPAPLAGWAWT